MEKINFFINGLYKKLFFASIGFLLVVQLSGCAGLAVFSKYRKELPESELKTYMRWYPSKEKLLDGYLGIPSEIICQPDNKEIWVYDGELVWSGAMVVVIIIPIPLVLPVGKSYKVFNIEGNIVKSTVQKSAYQCGFGGYVGPTLFFGVPIGISTETYNSCHFSQDHQSQITHFKVTSHMPGLTKSSAANYCAQKGADKTIDEKK